MPTIRSEQVHLEVNTSATATANWVDVCGKSFDPSGSQRSEIDDTNWCDTAKKKNIGMIDNGSIGIEYSFDPTNVGQNHLRELYYSGKAGKFRLKYLHVTPNQAQTFDAFVSAHGTLPKLAPDATATIPATLLVNGAVSALAPI